MRITRGMPVGSESLGLYGICDVVEFHKEVATQAGGHSCGGDALLRVTKLLAWPALKQEDAQQRISTIGATTSHFRIVPVEYKLGKPKEHRADEVQLCAQGMCLEEMLGRNISQGDLYYGTTRRRVEVSFDADLRALVTTTSHRFRDMMQNGVTPPAEYSKKKYEACSLIDICQPLAGKRRGTTAAWFSRELEGLL